MDVVESRWFDLASDSDNDAMCIMALELEECLPLIPTGDSWL
jgi:hypothetical protein